MRLYNGDLVAYRDMPIVMRDCRTVVGIVIGREYVSNTAKPGLWVKAIWSDNGNIEEWLEAEEVLDVIQSWKRAT